MDIFSHTCCKKLVSKADDLKEHEIEIVSAESAEEEVEEEELGSQLEVVEKLDARAISAELECMKRRILKLQIKLKVMRMEKCPGKPCEDLNLELTCSENKEVCALQKDQYKLQCQITELIRCIRVIKGELKDIHMRMCNNHRDLLQLRKILGELQSWKNTLEHEFAVCLQRFEYLKSIKAEWKDFLVELAQQQDWLNTTLKERYVKLDYHYQEKQKYEKDINEIRLLFRNLHCASLERYNEIEKQIEELRLLEAETAAAAAEKNLAVKKVVQKNINN